MYWFRHGNPLEMAPWLAVIALCALGGWLLATHTFRLERSERLLAGLGLGVFIYLWIVNVIGRWLPPLLTFTLPALIVLLTGLVFAWKGKRPWLDWRDLQVWGLLLSGVAMLWLFIRVGKGVGVFDEYKNVSLISTMAAGDIPPHHIQSSTVYYSYHYGFQLLGASLMRLGGLFPWSAYDFSKALVGTYGVLLAFLLGKRLIPHPTGGLAAALVLLFADGTRYLLMLLPPSLLVKLNPLITLQGNSAFIDVGFSRAMVRAWEIEGGPPYPFAFAYTNGILAWPRFMGMQAGPSSLALALMLLIWLLASREQRRASLGILVVLFALWGLAWESSYALVGIAGVILAAFSLWRGAERRKTLSWITPLLISAPLVFLQGGTITGMARALLFGSAFTGSNAEAASSLGFGLRWPPAIVSAHLGSLRLTSPLELLAAFFELGPVILFTPWVTAWAFRRFRGGDWMLGVLVLSAWMGLVFPIFLTYNPDRDITRFTAHGLLVWTFALVLLLGEWPQGWSRLIKDGAYIALGLMVFGGVVISGIALTATTQVLLPDPMTELDARVAAQTWDALPKGSEVFDPAEWRATALTGRLTRATSSSDVRSLAPEWQALYDNPSVEGMLAAGYPYVYIDEKWWETLSGESRSSLDSPCVQEIALYTDQERGWFRRLIDLSPCK